MRDELLRKAALPVMLDDELPDELEDADEDLALDDELDDEIRKPAGAPSRCAGA